MPDRVSTDWDALLTFTLTLLISLGTLGIANLLALSRVVSTARVRLAEIETGRLLLVPGKRLVDGRPDGDFEYRLRRAAELSAHQPNHRILILGGVTGNAPVSEAAAGARFIRSLPDGESLHVELESTSRDTLTNLRNVRDMLRYRPDATDVILISNRYHLARIGLIADSLGIAHRLCPAEDRCGNALTLWPVLLRESFFYLWFVVGKGWAILTRNRRMLERVT
jgi:uncharacterized SAM-binding protein YcdF (DUF218 family)